MNPILLVYIVLFVAVFYLLAVRPQRRQRRAHQEMVSMLKKGDEIVTIGGLFGTVRKIGPTRSSSRSPTAPGSGS